ncbi:glycosyltransferase [Amnibacterium sp. CER49]|uniref:glycosyltransferase n=1 Tax=Amnibacterium sp. CER49 TaxID=3039161 RepID=UPI002449B306|nr:glycosyltransferase [Amnibacterium sp. CER49]MDH2443065.1 glycosyltransferase [Amnibacterium sp. CER49]
MTSSPTRLPRHALPVQRMRVAFVGTRGVAAGDSGAGTAVEEIGRRLVARGHEVTVYGSGLDVPATSRLGMRLVPLPALGDGNIGTVGRAALAGARAALGQKQDVAFLFDGSNAPALPLLRARGTAVAVHLEGLEEQRGRWGAWGRRYCRFAERWSVRQADALIADVQSTAGHVHDAYGLPSELIGFGGRVVRNVPADALEARGLVPGGFHLVVASFVPEHHVDVVLEGYRRSGATLPIVVVGSGPHRSATTRRIEELAHAEPRIRLLGDVTDERLLDQLYAHAACYVHGHGVGGAHPSLLRAMGAGTAVIAWQVVFNREVVGTAGLYFASPNQLAPLLTDVERYPLRFVDIGELLQERTRRLYDWDSVAEAYEALAVRLHRGFTTRGMSDGRRPAPVALPEPVAWHLPR